MKENIIKIKSFDFALHIIEIFQTISEQKKEYVLSKQMLRSGTSIGASIREAEHAESKADFIHKMSISLKEANETEYWIELLYRAAYIDLESYNTLISELTELLKLLTSIVKSAKKKNQWIIEY